MKKGFLTKIVFVSVFSFFILFGFSHISEAVQDEYSSNRNTTPKAPLKLPEGATDSQKATAAYLNNTPSPVVSNSTAGNDDGIFTNALQYLALEFVVETGKFVAWIIHFVGILFDKVIEYTTEYPEDIGSAIKDSWKVVRDLTNIFIVFSLLYLGIKTILDGQGFADKKTLIGVILAAILINFSFVFVKDFAFGISNAVGTKILAQSKTGNDKNSAANKENTEGSYSAGIMQMVNPQMAFKYQGFALRDDNNVEGYTVWNVAQNSRTDWGMVFKLAGQVLMFSFITITMGVVFFSASILLLFRFFVFIILMITAPIGIVGSQIPWFEKYGSEWFGHLKKQVFFLPAFAFCLYIVLYITTTLAGNGHILSSEHLNGGIGTIFDYLFKFALIVGFLVALILLPSKIGAVGADFASGATSYVRRKGLQGLAGGSARFGRYAIGNKFAGKLGGLNDEKAKKQLQLKVQQGGLGGFIAKKRLDYAEGLKNRTYDVRNTEIGKRWNLGKGITSYADEIKAKKEAFEEKKKKEMKAYGYDKAHETAQNAIDIGKAKTSRDSAAKELEEAQENFKSATKSGASPAMLKTFMNTVKTKEKLLEIQEREVGRLMNLGEDNYMKQYNKKISTRIKNAISFTSRGAIEASTKETKKRWALVGQSRGKKKEKAETKKVDKELES